MHRRSPSVARALRERIALATTLLDEMAFRLGRGASGADLVAIADQLAEETRALAKLLEPALELDGPEVSDRTGADPQELSREG